MGRQSTVTVNYAHEWESEEVERGIWPMADVWTRLFSVVGRNATMPLAVLAVTTYNAEGRRFRTTCE